MYYLIYGGLASASFIFLFLFFVVLKQRTQLKILKSKKSELTTDANQLLAQLMQGGAVITVQVVSPSEIFQWSPKDIT
jgi:hypothetical protein